MDGEDTYTQTEIVRSLKRLEESITDTRRHIDDRLDNLGHGFVSKELYDADRRTYAAEMDGLKTSVNAARSLAMWSLGLIVTSVVGAIIFALFSAVSK